MKIIEINGASLGHGIFHGEIAQNLHPGPLYLYLNALRDLPLGRAHGCDVMGFMTSYLVGFKSWHHIYIYIYIQICIYIYIHISIVLSETRVCTVLPLFVPQLWAMFIENFTTMI